MATKKEKPDPNAAMREVLDESIPTGPEGQQAPASMPTGVHRSMSKVNAATETEYIEKTEQQPLDLEEEQQELVDRTQMYVDREWEKQRKANLRSGIITRKDSRTYRMEVKRDIDGDPMMDEANLERKARLDKIAQRPQGWVPAAIQRVSQTLPPFLRRVLSSK